MGIKSVKLKSGIRNRESEIRNRESEIGNWESEIGNPKSNAYLCSKIQL
jgi:hypothetical protein